MEKRVAGSVKKKKYINSMVLKICDYYYIMQN